MGWLERSIAAALEQKDQALSEILGGDYSIESIDNDRAVVRTETIECLIWYDRRRDCAIGSELNLGVGERWQYTASLERFLQFLGEAPSADLPKGQSGVVKLTLDEQILRQLEMLGRVAAVLNPTLARDAAFFARGYNEAYTDYASGKWSSR